MATLLSRIIRYGWQSFQRNGWLSLATIGILLLALIVFQGLIIFNVVTKIALDTLKDKIDISVYFKPETAEPSILGIQKVVESWEEIKVVEYTSREKALALFKEKHKNDTTITQALKELEDNPLSASLNVKAKDPEQYAAIAKRLNGQKQWQAAIEKVTYYQNKLVIERLGKIVDTTEKFGFALTFFLSLAAILVTFNTVSLAIYSNRDEISIMRLVGASNSFITGPYVVTGLIYAFVAAILSMAIIWPTMALAAPYLKFFISEIDIATYYSNNFWSLLGYQLIFAAVLGVVSSKIAIRKYLKI